jgi:hypothetical protein
LLPCHKAQLSLAIRVCVRLCGFGLKSLV